jgi:hypothetical protein
MFRLSSPVGVPVALSTTGVEGVGGPPAAN